MTAPTDNRQFSIRVTEVNQDGEDINTLVELVGNAKIIGVVGRMTLDEVNPLPRRGRKPKGESNGAATAPATPATAKVAK